MKLHNSISSFFNDTTVFVIVLLFILVVVILSKYISNNTLSILISLPSRIIIAILVAYMACINPYYSILLTTLLVVLLTEKNNRNNKNNLLNSSAKMKESMSELDEIYNNPIHLGVDYDKNFALINAPDNISQDSDTILISPLSEKDLINQHYSQKTSLKGLGDGTANSLKELFVVDNEEQSKMVMVDGMEAHPVNNTLTKNVATCKNVSIQNLALENNFSGINNIPNSYENTKYCYI